MKLTDVVFYSSNIEKSKDFYKSLGLVIESDRSNYISFKTESTVLLSINLVDTPAKQKALGGGSISFDVENIQELANRLRIQGVEFYKDVFEVPFGKMFSILDLDGNKIMFVQRN